MYFEYFEKLQHINHSLSHYLLFFLFTVVHHVLTHTCLYETNSNSYNHNASFIYVLFVTHCFADHQDKPDTRQRLCP